MCFGSVCPGGLFIGDVAGVDVALLVVHGDGGPVAGRAGDEHFLAGVEFRHDEGADRGGFAQTDLVGVDPGGDGGLEQVEALAGSS